MKEFLAQNLSTILVGLLVLAIFVLTLRKLYKDKKSGKSSCGCDCGCGCSHCSTGTDAKKK